MQVRSILQADDVDAFLENTTAVQAYEIHLLDGLGDALIHEAAKAGAEKIVARLVVNVMLRDYVQCSGSSSAWATTAILTVDTKANFRC